MCLPGRGNTHFYIEYLWASGKWCSWSDSVGNRDYGCANWKVVREKIKEDGKCSVRIGKGLLEEERLRTNYCIDVRCRLWRSDCERLRYSERSCSTWDLYCPFLIPCLSLEIWFGLVISPDSKQNALKLHLSHPSVFERSQCFVVSICTFYRLRSCTPTQAENFLQST